ncbi:Setd3 [Symbiodinium natans]|uniref:Setd3 protein n=1 Tax=Symbiodinium natans TaxID=878477 RepID=A0A812Q5N7_9DINO|nr:Setd3 [Symbiodinium natans]
MPVSGRRHWLSERLLLVVAVPGVDAFASKDCWVGGWTPEICCSAPGAKGNPLCWDSVFTYDRCCTETEEGIQFDLRRRNFVADMVRRGATVHFDIRQVSGGRTGAVASRTLPARSTVLRVPSTQVFSLKSVHSAVVEASRRHSCDAHAILSLGLALERVNPNSVLADWIKLLPLTFANVLWFSDRQLDLVQRTFFSYIVQNWFEDLDCMGRAAKEMNPNLWRGRPVTKEDLRWALSVVKTRGFAFEGTRESTMLIPLADFLNHNMVASVRTATLAEDALRFVATKDVMPGDELCIDYAQASNLEFLVRYGFRVEDNPFGGRQFELGGEPMQVMPTL